MNSKCDVIDKSEITGSEWNSYFKELLNNDVNIDEDFKTMTDALLDSILNYVMLVIIIK